jgi:hypothetical protein
MARTYPSPESGERAPVGDNGPMPQATSPVPTKPALLTAYRVVAGVLSVLVIVQAVIAGQSEDLGYGDWSIVPHGILGNISFLLAVASHAHRAQQATARRASRVRSSM